jgi:hypothetical protein
MKTKKWCIRATIAIGISLLSIGNAWSATYAAKISNILFYEDGNLFYIYLQGGTQGRPACAGSNGDYLSFSMNRPRAREYIAGLMMAFATDKSVTFYTAGACVDQSVSDTIRYFVLNSQ